MVNALTVDIEEYFHPTEVQIAVGTDDWSVLPSRIEAQTRLILDVLSRRNVSATFFVLGWVAERHPMLICDVVAAGHEIGCHSYAHKLVYELTPSEFRADLNAAVASIQNACGVTPRAYRAPSYSITSRCSWALEILVESGFTHDSSIYPIRHDRYGIPGFSRRAIVINTPAGPIQEIPIATVALSTKRIAPVGGGAYLRLLPYRYTAAGIRFINENDKQPACIYLHPWELDPGVPRLTKGILSRLRTYSGLRSMKGKLERLVNEFKFAPLTHVYPSCDAGRQEQQPLAVPFNELV